jgi:hypothetical protein
MRDAPTLERVTDGLRERREAVAAAVALERESVD